MLIVSDLEQKSSHQEDITLAPVSDVTWLAPYKSSALVQMASRPVNYMSMSLRPHFIFYKMSSLVSGNAGRNIMTAIKAFGKSRDGSLGRNIVCREGKSVSSSHVNKVMSLS